MRVGYPLCPDSEEPRIAAVQVAHQRVARGLGQDGRGADRRHLRITLHHRLEQALEAEPFARRDNDCRR